jgi:hypothetical protein
VHLLEGSSGHLTDEMNNVMFELRTD